MTGNSCNNIDKVRVVCHSRDTDARELAGSLDDVA